jgi:hypothetical protein
VAIRAVGQQPGEPFAGVVAGGLPTVAPLSPGHSAGTLIALRQYTAPGGTARAKAMQTAELFCDEVGK